MAKIHKVRKKEQLSPATIVAEKSWEWCQEHLSHLLRIFSKKGPPVWWEDDDSELAQFRETEQIIIVEVERREGEKTDYFYSEVSPQQLDEKLAAE